MPTLQPWTNTARSGRLTSFPEIRKEKVVTVYTLECYPNTKITGISMPSEEGGCPVGFESENVQSVVKNVGTLAGDLGVSDIPETHQMTPSLTMERVLCKELPARKAKRKKPPRKGKIPPCERKLRSDSPEYIRIQTAQLILATENLRENGTMVVLMRKPENPPTTELLRLFSQFSEISLFKHRHHYQTTSSFYMVAKNVQTRSEKATRAIAKRRKKWKETTLRQAGEADESEESVGDEFENVSDLIGAQC
ncbi:FtsJ-like methyltransferase family protein [Metarhizium acridum CQMa 102]|uniref:FtsJ-like methyltransferase family protein n=1 Tax=Metarhizium acridum (strain CQMa 102) TaxID=655827 RepID=E9EBZ7_METAQ|nr:FtsJ-like methyltransferase family protein [Metarhizium acridum CQMa 102]EFY86533.1 FtsJ-like methyltransferase family protein [Metarhizium acridum CQMa 102]